MMANKKTFDREKMYRKIMPTYYDNNFALAPDPATPNFDDEHPAGSYLDAPELEEPMFDDVDFEEQDSDEASQKTVVTFPLSNPPSKKKVETPFGGFEGFSNSTLLRTAEIERIKEQHNSTAVYNLTEKIIMEKLDMVMEGMNCCRCDRCKMDVIALTLNHMQPSYVVRSQNSPDYSKLEAELSEQATKEILKAVLRVRKSPRH